MLIIYTVPSRVHPIYTKRIAETIAEKNIFLMATAITTTTTSRAAPMLLKNLSYFVRGLNTTPLSAILPTVPPLNSTPEHESSFTTATTSLPLIDHTAVASQSSVHTTSLSAATTVSPPDTTIDLNDVSRLFESISTAKLLRSFINLHIAAMDPVVDLGMGVMRSGVMDTPLIRDVVVGVIKHTFFEHFVAGQTPEEAGETVRKMWNNGAGLRGMMVYALEHTDDNQSCDRNLDGFRHTVRSAKSLPKSSVSCVIVKISAICPMGLLVRVSHLLRWQRKDPSFRLPWKRDTLPIFSDCSPMYHTLVQPNPLSPQEEHDLQLGFDRLHKICEDCLEANITLSIDAEDTIVQPAIDYITYSSAVKYNTGTSLIIVGTIQAYLKDAKSRLISVANAAQKMGVPMGFKIVRGAYMSSERKLASDLGFESPIHNSIQETHDCYNDCTHFMLDKISNGWGSVVLATHNIESGKMAAKQARELGIKSDNEKLQFAQLYGMSEALSFGLKNAGFTVSKYMPFGPIDVVMPYLLRRAEENRGMLSSSTLDRTLMSKELKRRIGRCIFSK